MKASLSTSNFNITLKNYILRAVKIIVGLIIIASVNRLLCQLIVNDIGSYTRITFHELYTQDSIDTLFLGSSHTCFSIDTDITDENFGVNTFNAGTPAQNFDGSYAILLEACKKYNIKNVYLDVYYSTGQGKRKDRTPYHVNIISDYLRPSVNRTRFLLQATPKEHYINSFFIPRRYWNGIFEDNYFSAVMDIKSNPSYADYEYIVNEDDYYAGKGYTPYVRYIQDYHNRSTSYFKGIPDTPVLDENLRYLKKIIKYCKKNDINLTLVSVPIPDFNVYNLQNYDYYIEYMKALAEKNNISYYDFNLCRPEYFNGNDCYFFDNDHLNKDGAEAFSRLFSDFFTGKIKEEDLFYGSYEEKVKNIPYKILGYFDCVEGEDDNAARYFTLSAIDHINQEYKISIESVDEDGNEGEIVLVQDFSTNTKIPLVKDEHGKIYVELQYNDLNIDMLVYDF